MTECPRRRQARGGGEPHVPGADDRDLAHGQSLTYSVTASRQGRSDGSPARRSARLSSALICGRAAGRSRSAASIGAMPDGSTPRASQRGDDQLVAGDGLAPAGDVEQALAPLHREPGEQHREVGRVGGDAHLVGEHAVELAAVVGAERPAHEVGPPAAEHPRRADGRPRRGVPLDLQLPAELRPAVLRDRMHRVPLVVGAARLAVEHVVGGDVHEVRAAASGRLGERAARRARSPRRRAPGRARRRRRWSSPPRSPPRRARTRRRPAPPARDRRDRASSRAAPSTSWCPSRASTTRAPT